MTENMCKRPPVHRKTEESGHRMPAEKFLFPQRMVRAYNSPKPEGYLGNANNDNTGNNGSRKRIVLNKGRQS